MRAGEVVERGDAPGVAIAVVSGDAIVATAAAGAADLAHQRAMAPDVACNWFSMTKIATATAAMVLVDQGALDLDAPVAEHLGDLWPRGFGEVRVRHLLNHSSGLRNPIPIRWVHRADQAGPDEREFLARLLDKQPRPRFTPGSRASYSNVGYLALGVIIGEVSGDGYTTFVRNALLEPLGMSHTGFRWTDASVASAPRATGFQRASRPAARLLDHYLPAGIIGPRFGKLIALQPFELDGPAYGGLIGPVADAARLVALHCNDGTVAGRRLLSPRSVREMSSIAMPGKPYDLGLGWFRPHGEPGGHVEHLGGGMGFWNLLRIEPGTGHGVAIMSNTSRRWAIAALGDEAVADTLDAARPSTDTDR